MDSNRLETLGWCTLNEGVPENLLETVSRNFDYIYSKYKNPNYSNVSSLTFSELHEISELSSVYGLVAEHVECLYEGKLAFQKLWLVKSSPSVVSAEKVPYVPHIDRMRFVKVMIYIDSVSERDGPLTLSNTHTEKYESLRRSLPSDYQNKGLNVIRENIEYQTMLGDQGTVILFDTNCPHYAGNVYSSGHRRVLRFDFMKPEWNMFKKRKRKAVSKIFNYIFGK